MSNKPKIWGHLLVDVIRAGKCVACGSCATSCPENAIGWFDDLPKLIGKCKACGDCYAVCPRSEYNYSELERGVLGCNSSGDIPIGVYHNVLAVKTLEADVSSRCQDGGAVTSILNGFLVKGGDSAVVAGLKPGEAWVPVPVVTRDRATIVNCAGTKYTSAPMLRGLQEAQKLGGKIAMVGIPCQIQALRRREKFEAIKESVPKKNYLAIGLLCMETFDYDKLITFLKENNLDPFKIKKFEIKSGKFIAHIEGASPFEVKVRKLKDMMRQCCRTCVDYTAELADISVGNVGSPAGYSTVIIRTEKGEEAVKHAEKIGLIETKSLLGIEPGLSIVYKLSSSKKVERGAGSEK